jgi:hypothetical protein
MATCTARKMRKSTATMTHTSPVITSSMPASTAAE